MPPEILVSHFHHCLLLLICNYNMNNNFYAIHILSRFYESNHFYTTELFLSMK